MQRVSRASVRVSGAEAASIDAGFVVLLGVAVGDTEDDARKMADKIRRLRVFPDNAGVMNRSIEEANGEVLVVSQFTLLGDARRGNRPSYLEAALPELAEPLYQVVCRTLRESGLRVGEGVFRTDMQVELVNDGPVTILLDSAKAF